MPVDEITAFPIEGDRGEFELTRDRQDEMGYDTFIEFRLAAAEYAVQNGLCVHAEYLMPSRSTVFSWHPAAECFDVETSLPWS